MVQNACSAPPGAWKGDPLAAGWWWQVDFAEPRAIASIAQIVGDSEVCFQNAPRRYVWQASEDRRAWRDIEATRVGDERRLQRLFRLRAPIRARALRLTILEAQGSFPAIRAVRFSESADGPAELPAWAVVVSTTTRYEPMREGEAFIPLARRCRDDLAFQHIWLGDFNPAFLECEPRPLCAFLSGSFRDWCEVEREPWRGAQEILRAGALPMWASCGGAQGLAILAETGVDRPWDCPHCRDSSHPKLPIYTHVGHFGECDERPCGDYSRCVSEKGPTRIRQVRSEAVFRGLNEEFVAVESHCGQIEWAPRGWELIAVGGAGAKTRVQCLKVEGRPIYAAQFHIELDGAPETSRAIMSNFLAEASALRDRG